MKKYISLLLATAATIACTKVALEDNSPIESLPQEGNTENVQGEPSGEKIIISLAETKVSLDEYGDYQFDGDEVIYVQASSTKAVAKLQNSAAKPTTFTGEFNGLLGETSETFDFYYNCTDENANVVTDENGNVVVVKVQNGQPWLAATGVEGKRSEASEYSYELNNVMLKQLDGYVCLALNSDYPCTVDFHSLSAEIPAATQDKTIAGMSVTAGKPYFVNINTDTDGEFKGGFYLAVNKTGKTGTMYTSYATAKPISKNTRIQIKTDFTPLSGTVSFDGFKTTYDIAKTDLATANTTNSNVMTSGTITVTLSGISSKLDFVESVTFFDGDTEFTLTDKSKSGNTYTFNVGKSDTHNDVGQRTLTAKVNFKSPVSSSTNINGETIRHITGLPYKADFTSNRGNMLGWTANNARWTSSIPKKLSIDKGSITSPQFHIPADIKISGNCNIQYYQAKLGNFSDATFSFGTTSNNTSGPIFNTTETSIKGNNKTSDNKTNKTFNSTFSTDYTFFSIAGNKDYCIVYDVTIQYSNN